MKSAILLLCLGGCIASPGAVAASSARDILFVQPSMSAGGYEAVVLATSSAGDAPATRLSLGVYLQGFAVGRVMASPPVADDSDGCIEAARVQLAGDTTGIGDAGAILSSVDINPKQRHTMRDVSTGERDALLDALTGIGRDEIAVLKRGLDDDANAARGIRILTDAGRDETAILAFTLMHSRGEEITSVLALMERDANGAWTPALVDLRRGCSDCDGVPTRYSLKAFGDFDGDGAAEFLLQGDEYESWSYHLLRSGEKGWKRENIGGGGGC